VALFGLLDYRDLHNPLIWFEIFDQISCFDNLPFRVVTSARRVCFLMPGINVLLSPKAEMPPGTRHDCGVFLIASRRAVKIPRAC